MSKDSKYFGTVANLLPQLSPLTAIFVKPLGKIVSDKFAPPYTTSLTRMKSWHECALMITRYFHHCNALYKHTPVRNTARASRKKSKSDPTRLQ